MTGVQHTDNASCAMTKVGSVECQSKGIRLKLGLTVHSAHNNVELMSCRPGEPMRTGCGEHMPQGELKSKLSLT